MFLWKQKLGVIPIVSVEDFCSCACEDTYRFPLTPDLAEFGATREITRLNLPFKFLLKADLNQNLFIPYSFKLNNGDCSLMAERVVVVRKTRVRFSPFTLKRGLK